MIAVSLTDTTLIVQPGQGDLKPRDENQLAFWGFARDADNSAFSATVVQFSELPRKVVSYFTKIGASFQIDDQIGILLERHEERQASLHASIERCRQMKDGVIDSTLMSSFISFLSSSIARKLKDHQVKAALHLLVAANGANFSVPGSGKTTVVLSVYEYLKQIGEVDALFVVGPPACFGPWKYEFKEVLGREPVAELLAGGNVEDRRSRYLVNTDSVPDLFLTTFQTLQRDWEYVRDLFLQRGVRFYLVIDEAHYVKQIGGAWSSAVLNVAKYAAHRCVLTGTPFPRSFADAFNLFDVLWPDPSPIGFQDRHRITLHLQRSEEKDAAAVLQRAIGPLFYRVRKSELGLAEQVFHEPISVPMNARERQVYDSIVERVALESQSDFFRDFELLVRLRKGRMMRLRQCVSYAGLLSSALPEYDEDLLADNQSLSNVLRHYDDFESPGKIAALIELVQNLHDSGHKVVVWSNFVRTLKLIVNQLSAIGCRVGLIYGGTPFEVSDVDEVMSREMIIRNFTLAEGGLDVLVANPAACAESVSLHKSCSHAIYYDLSYNCAQYLQSLDRIHRVGGSEEKPAHYYVLQYGDTLDRDILANLRKKAASMSEIIDKDYAIYSLDMFGDDGDLEAYERLFGQKQ